MMRSRGMRRMGAAFMAVAMGVAACGGDGGAEATGTTDDEQTVGAAAGSGEASYPITIDHVYGQTIIEAAPERVATVAWANHEVPLALGVVPVGMSKATWGDDDGDGVLPWVEERLAELDAQTPVLFDETDGIDAEAVADTAPDVILASYSGLTEDDYETLSKIAPVVAYPDIAWGTPVDEMIRMNATAMGMAAEGEDLIAELDAAVEAGFAAHPQLADKNILFSFIDPTDTSEIGFYTAHDTRPGFLHDLGMGVPELVEQRSAGTDAFYETISAEAADQLDDVDILVTYGASLDEILEMMRDDALLATIPAVQRGSIVVLEESTPLAASANPSPLSIGWGLDEYLALIAAAAAEV